MWRQRTPTGFIEPCLPSPAERPPSGPDWIHEIKHDGYRLMARRDWVGIRVLTRNGRDWSPRYPLIIEVVKALKVRSCLVDGEAVACNEIGLAVFERLRQERHGRHVFLYAFDLLGWQGPSTRTYRGTQGDAGQSLAVMRAGRASEPTPCDPASPRADALWAVRAGCRPRIAKATRHGRQGGPFNLCLPGRFAPLRPSKYPDHPHG